MDPFVRRVKLARWIRMYQSAPAGIETACRCPPDPKLSIPRLITLSVGTRKNLNVSEQEIPGKFLKLMHFPRQDWRNRIQSAMRKCMCCLQIVREKTILISPAAFSQREKYFSYKWAGNSSFVLGLQDDDPRAFDQH